MATTITGIQAKHVSGLPPSSNVAKASVEGLNNPAVDKGLSLSLACAEGNTNKDGSKRFLGMSEDVPNGYPADMHRDPGDNHWNKGRLSYAPTRHDKPSSMSVAECEQNAIKLINNKMSELETRLQQYGMSPANKNYRFVLACLMDSVNQTGDACFRGKHSLWNKMPDAIRRLNAGEDPAKVMTDARVASHAKDDGSCGSFEGSWARTRADQARRVGEIYDCLKAHGGLTPMTGKGANAPTPSAPAPTTPGSHSSFEAPSATANTPVLQPSLSTSQLLGRGDKGQGVQDLQRQLNLAGASPRLAEDGDFGPNTEAAVRSFQQQYALKVDGLAGPQTLAKLNEVLRSTSPSGQGKPAQSGSGDKVGGGLNAATLALLGGTSYKPSFEVRPGSVGPKVTELKQALKDAGFYSGAINDQMGPDGVSALKAAKEKLKLGGAPDVAGDFTLKALQEYAKANKAGGPPGTAARVEVGWISQFDNRVPGAGDTACDNAVEYMMTKLARRPTTPGQSNAEVRPFHGGSGQGPVNYLQEQLKAGRPVMLGVDYKAGDAGGANINGIDHYVLATGYGVDDKGRQFITFHDPAHTDEASGRDTNPENRLYLNESTGKWTQERGSKPYSLAGVVENR